MRPRRIVNNFFKKLLDKRLIVWYIIGITMKEINNLLNDDVFMPMIKFTATLIFLAIILDLGSQLTEAVDILTR